MYRYLLFSEILLNCLTSSSPVTKSEIACSTAGPEEVGANTKTSLAALPATTAIVLFAAG
jgi:hypothetical protein